MIIIDARRVVSFRYEEAKMGRLGCSRSSLMRLLSCGLFVVAVLVAPQTVWGLTHTSPQKSYSEYGISGKVWTRVDAIFESNVGSSTAYISSNQIAAPGGLKAMAELLGGEAGMEYLGNAVAVNPASSMLVNAYKSYSGPRLFQYAKAVGWGYVYVNSSIGYLTVVRNQPASVWKGMAAAEVGAAYYRDNAAPAGYVRAIGVHGESGYVRISDRDATAGMTPSETIDFISRNQGTIMVNV